MKRITIIMLVVFLWIPQITFARMNGRTYVELTNTRQGPLGRSMFPAPYVSYEGNTLYLLSCVSSTNVTVLIKDNDGMSVYEDICSIQKDKEKIIRFIGLSKGYILCLVINGETYKGIIE